MPLPYNSFTLKALATVFIQLYVVTVIILDIILEFSMKIKCSTAVLKIHVPCFITHFCFLNENSIRFYGNMISKRQSFRNFCGLYLDLFQINYRQNSRFEMIDLSHHFDMTTTDNRFDMTDDYTFDMTMIFLFEMSDSSPSCLRPKRQSFSFHFKETI